MDISFLVSRELLGGVGLVLFIAAFIVAGNKYVWIRNFCLMVSRGATYCRVSDNHINHGNGYDDVFHSGMHRARSVGMAGSCFQTDIERRSSWNWNLQSMAYSLRWH